VQGGCRAVDRDCVFGSHPRSEALLEKFDFRTLCEEIAAQHGYYRSNILVGNGLTTVGNHKVVG